MITLDHSFPHDRAIATLLAAQRGSPQPLRIYEALSQVMRDEIGHILFTILYQHQEPRELERLYTNKPEAYPVLGRKQIISSAWTEQVLERGMPYIGVNIDDIRKAFPDHKTIEYLGCASALNIPIVFEGVVMGSINLLHRSGYYKYHHIVPANLFASFAFPAFVRR